MGSGVALRPEGFDVTSQKQLKARIRARMATTGERYAAARAHLVGVGGDQDQSRAVVDAGWTLRGGSDPDAAALANILANLRVVSPEGPLSEELIFLVAGGLGAGYILWEFQHDDSRIVTLGFTNSAHYLDRRLSARHPRSVFAGARAELGPLTARLQGAIRLRLGEGQQQLGERAARLEGLSPLAVLGRGYAIATREDGRAVRNAADVSAGEPLGLRLHRGRVAVRVTAVELGSDDPGHEGSRS